MGSVVQPRLPRTTAYWIFLHNIQFIAYANFASINTGNGFLNEGEPDGEISEKQ